MQNCFSVDSESPNSFQKIRDYLFSELRPVINSKRPIIFLCIGTDRSTGDSLGPLVGYKLRYIHRNDFFVYGTLANPIHSKNLTLTLEKINKSFENPFIIGVDACLGSFQNVGKVFIEKKPITPGLALNKTLPPVGEMSITGIVNISGNFEFMILQNTRLHTVMRLADSISAGIHHFILKSSGNNLSSREDCINEIINFPNI